MLRSRLIFRITLTLLYKKYILRFNVKTTLIFFVLFILFQLLKDGEKKSASFWTFEYYQQFFDVETRDVFGRVLGSMTPLPSKRYLDQNIRPNPDLYGKILINKLHIVETKANGH